MLCVIRFPVRLLGLGIRQNLVAVLGGDQGILHRLAHILHPHPGGIILQIDLGQLLLQIRLFRVIQGHALGSGFLQQHQHLLVVGGNGLHQIIKPGGIPLVLLLLQGFVRIHPDALEIIRTAGKEGFLQLDIIIVHHGVVDFKVLTGHCHPVM